MQPQQKKSSTKPKSKVVAKKPTAKSVSEQRTKMIQKMKGDTTAPKKAMPKMKSGSACVPKMAMGTSGVQPKPKPKAKATVKETPKQYAERKAVKPMNITPLGAILVDGTPKGLPSGAVSARQRAAGQQTARQRAEVDKQRANLNAGVDNLERRAAQSKANREADNFIRPSGKSGVGRTNTTMGNFNTRSGNGDGRVKGATSQSCKRASDAAEATFKKAKGSSGIKTNKYPDGTKKIETKSQYEERKAMKPINLEIQKGPKPQMPDMEAATGKKMKDYATNKEYQGKMALKSLKNRQQPSKGNKNQNFGPNNRKVTKLMGSGSIFSAPSGFIPAMKKGIGKVC